MIDRITIAKIMDAADIVDVVSDFVSLKKSGANYKGLCPFHNDRTPSFMVSPAKGYCKCFSCGKGGNAVGFIMEHEQLTYPEALKYLARKYNIEVQERELTDDERRAQTERESLFIVNEWAANYFADNLHKSSDGVSIGLPYFRSRGFRDDIIERFKLGFDLGDRKALAQKAVAEGYKGEYLEKTGICYKTDRGELIDRFAGRVIFPWFGQSGKIVGFGGRLLDARTKGVAQKYVNSPDSEIYHKDSELYGLFQAKRAIAKENHVYMVEGYTDVISMHQCGIENVVANSGTALSVKQIGILHRLTPNITLLYDGDEAGVHAAMRGTDMLLSHGMNIKVLFLPDGDDPDSFARKHSAEEFRDYVERNQTDFIDFKCQVLLQGVTDPMKRAEAIDNVLLSVSLIKDQIKRSMYVTLCVEKLGVKEETIVRRVNKFIHDEIEQRKKRKEREKVLVQEQPPIVPETASAPVENVPTKLSKLQEIETLIIQMVVRHGEMLMPTEPQVTLAQLVASNLAEDELQFSIPIYNKILEDAVEKSGEDDFVAEKFFMRHEDYDINNAATRLIMDQANVNVKPDEMDETKLVAQTVKNLNHLFIDLRLQMISEQIVEARQRLATATADEMATAMSHYKQLKELQKTVAQMAGRN
ncbi:MAG: DNA primase [Bacteroidaceae bacterium]|nr:DNA primase [Bacteroidaceae bacterium]